MKSNIVWTQRLKLAVTDLANEAQPQDEDRQSLASDIKGRARQMSAMKPGATLEGHQIDFVSCLRSRLADHYVKFASKEEFESAWGEACRTADGR